MDPKEAVKILRYLRNGVASVGAIEAFDCGIRSSVKYAIGKPSARSGDGIMICGDCGKVINGPSFCGFCGSKIIGGETDEKCIDPDSDQF